MSSAACLAPASSRSSTTTWAPSPASRAATARPMPLAPPVTTAVRRVSVPDDALGCHSPDDATSARSRPALPPPPRPLQRPGRTLQVARPDLASRCNRTAPRWPPELAAARRCMRGRRPTVRLPAPRVGGAVFAVWCCVLRVVEAARFRL
jgi:hypothetical protein